VTRLPILALALLSLVVGLWSGLVRAGVALGPPSAEALAAHGALMVGATLGTLIALERAVALGERWAFAAPIASGLAGLGATLGAPFAWVTWALVFAGAVLVLASLRVVQRQPALFTLVLALGALAWLLGNLGWASGLPIHRLALSWLAFLVLTIVGERLELSRLRRPPPSAVRALGALVLLFCIGSLLSATRSPVGAPLAGVALVGFALWLFRHDVARRTLGERGLPRFIAVCLLSGYAWLLVGGVLMVRAGTLVPGLEYDAVLHSLFLGFVFSMIFGHAPVILPAVVGVSIPSSRALYAPLVLLHASVAVRIAADLSVSPSLRATAAILNVAALASYPATILLTKLVVALRRTPCEECSPT